jgi:hypothetical protein
MARIIDEAALALEKHLGLALPSRPTCYVTDPETAFAVQHVSAAAYSDFILIGVPERHLSEFGGTIAHELAHIFSSTLRRRHRPFMSEGFACYAAAAVGAQKRPCGLPVHYHVAWALGRGVKVSLTDLWDRRDYTAALYDIAWSFTSYCVSVHGQQRYLDLYRSGEMRIDHLVAEQLGVPLRKLEREWHDFARAEVGVSPAQISRMHRYDGYCCSRADWLKTH